VLPSLDDHVDTMTTALARQELYDLVWSEPMLKVGARYEVSSSYLARVCTLLNVPRPERGYWAKLAVGRAPPKPPLPDPLPGDPITWTRDGSMPTLKAAPRLPTELEGATKERRKPRLPKTNIPAIGTHGLIRGAKIHFESGRPVDDGNHLKPYKKLLVDVTASKTGLDKALGFANDLFNALESVGYRVVLAPNGEQLRRGQIDELETPRKRQGYFHSNLWSPYRPTLVYVGTVAIGLAIIEMSEEVLMRYVNGKYIRDADYVAPKSSRRYHDHTWTTAKELPCGRLRLVAYSPYWRASWQTSWQESKNSSLSREISQMIKAIENAAIELVEKLKEADRQAEIARLERLAEEEKRRQEEDRRRSQQSIKDSKDHLGQIIQSWGSAMTVERFLKDVEERAKMLPADECQQILERLRLAREFVGTQNPLDFFTSWKTPLERYQPLASRNREAAHETKDDDEDNDLDDEAGW
jgi:hypothetical protein